MNVLHGCFNLYWLGWAFVIVFFICVIYFTVVYMKCLLCDSCFSSKFSYLWLNSILLLIRFDFSCRLLIITSNNLFTAWLSEPLCALLGMRTIPTKIILQNLPPKITEDEIKDMCSPIPPHDYFRFCPPDPSLGGRGFSRVYINFCDPQAAEEFRERFNDYVFIDSQVRKPMLVLIHSWNPWPPFCIHFGGLISQ